MYVKRKGEQEESVQQEQWGLNLESKVAFRVLIITCNAVLGPTSQSLLFPLYFCPAINCSPSPLLFCSLSFLLSTLSLEGNNMSLLDEVFTNL